MAIGYLPFARALSVNGDGTGAFDMAGADYSGGQDFSFSTAARTLTDDLNEALDASETAVDVDAGTEFITGDIISVDDERMIVTGIAANTITVIRGVQGTTAATHDTGSNIIKVAREAVVTRMMVYGEDGASTISPALFVGGTALTNGIKLTVQDSSGNELADLTGAGTLKTTGDIAGYCYDVARKAFGAGNDVLVARWTFTKHTPDGIVLDGGDKLVANVSDNIGTGGSAVISFYLLVEGYYMDTYTSIDSTGLF